MVSNQCRWVRRRLPLLAGEPADAAGNLPWTERRQVDRHLIGCPSCRVERESLCSSISRLQETAAASVCNSDLPSVWPELARQIRASRRARPSFFRLISVPVLSIAAGFLVCGIVIGQLGIGDGSRKRSRATDRAEVLPRPRQALPDTDTPEIPAVVATKLPTSLTLELDSVKPGTSTNPKDPQRSQ